MTQLAERIAEIDELVSALVSGARLAALAVLDAAAIKTKRRRAREFVQRIETAARIGAGLETYFLVKETPVAWPPALRADIEDALAGGPVDSRKLERLRQRVDLDIRSSLAGLEEALAAEPLLASMEALLAEANRFFEPAAAAEGGGYAYRRPDEPASPGQVLTGPLAVALDPAFEPTYSLLQRPVPTFGDTVAKAVPYFWGLAIRESLAADLCALSAIEYDSMPLQFYRDMAKQCWDEMRHASYFFDAAIDMLDELEAGLDEDDPLSQNIRRFRTTGAGLPIPKERNLYEAILNAGLKERLILLHRDTETPGIQRIKEKIHSGFCRERPHIAEALEIVLRDEVTHSRFGNRWLEYLVPDRDEREALIIDTELLRGVYLLASFAHHGETPLSELVAAYAGGKQAPQSAVQLHTVPA